jgi:S-formylglutathione hydrolase FrmB
MALYQAEYYSKALAKTANFYIVLPNDVGSGIIAENECYQREMKTLYLLHGYSSSYRDWLLDSSVRELAVKYNLAIVMPAGDNSFYLDGKGTGKAYGRYIGKELVEYIRKTFGLSAKKEDTYIGGYSMGGFGALHTGLMYPDNFGKIMALSSALIIHEIKNKKADFNNGIADYDYYYSVFGDLDKLENSMNNPEFVIRKLKEEGKEIPPIYMACGTEDFLLHNNREFYSFLKKEDIEVQYVEDYGVHDWKFWNRYLEPAIQWLLS